MLTLIFSIETARTFEETVEPGAAEFVGFLCLGVKEVADAYEHTGQYYTNTIHAIKSLKEINGETSR